jgi:YqxM protein
MKMIKKVTNSVLNILQRLHSLLRTNEEGRTIRKTRLRKFKTKNKKLLIATKIVAIWYLLIISGSYLTSDTGAYFNDVEVLKQTIQVGEWEDKDNNEWDNSSLDFDGTRAWADGSNVFSTIKNVGDEANTISTWRYYLYKVINDKPSGDPVATGVVPIIESDKEGVISATVEENGEYRFTIRRPLGHPAKDNEDYSLDGYTYIGWSEKITVTSITNGNENSSPGSDQPIGEVNNLKWVESEKGNSGKYLISWTIPESTNFKHVRIYKGTEIFVDNFSNQEIELKSENKSKTYKITTVDIFGNESAGVTITISNEGIVVE